MEVALLHLKTADPILAEIIAKVGPYRLMTRKATFETLAKSITFQQLSGKAAGTIFARLKQAAGGRQLSPRRFLRLSEEELRACGLSRQKIASITDLAERSVRRDIQFSRLRELNDEEIIELLCRVRGVGVWTVQMFLMFALERPNIMPLSDLGIRNAVQKAYKLAAAPKPADLARIAEKWHPYRSVATWYLWRSLEGQAQI
ncbi:MAG: DNA-3-methyladenine glycosylase family protein [Bryobacteraceae bacterium]